MNQNLLIKKLRAGETIYLRDDFEEACIRLYADKDGTHAFLKHTHTQEIARPQSNEKVFNITLGGKEISKKEYNEH